MTNQKIRVLEVLRFINPILMFSFVFFGLGWIVRVPLVLAVSVACLSGVIAFTVISMLLSIQRKKQ